MPKKALVTGITGQDGSYLAELLLHKGYEVHGIVRSASTSNTKRIDHLLAGKSASNGQLVLHHGDISDSEQISAIVNKTHPDEVYHLAAQSQVQVSFDMPEYTGNITGLGTTRVLEAIRQCENSTRFYQASSSEIFGKSTPPQSEDTPLRPLSPYAAAKAYAHWVTVGYRIAYGLFASNGILFNHESPRRGCAFVTRKVTKAVANILAGRQAKLYLGNLTARRDWGFAPEYVELMWRMLQREAPDDYVIGTGDAHSVEEFLQLAFDYAGLDYREHVEIDNRFRRPAEVEELCADCRKARSELQWRPRVTFEDLVKIMVDADVRALGHSPAGEGERIVRARFPDRWWETD